jgi:hypothetical protein
MSAKKTRKEALPPTPEEAAKISAVVGQAVRAYGETLAASLQDPMSEVFRGAPFLDKEASEGLPMRERLWDQILKNNRSGQRLDRARNQSGNEKKAEVLFLSCHLSMTEGEEIPVNPWDMTGFIRYSDEACAALLNHWLLLDTEGTKAWDAVDVRNLRRKHGIDKMPKRFLVSKIVGTDGVPLSGK